MRRENFPVAALCPTALVFVVLACAPVQSSRKSTTHSSNEIAVTVPVIDSAHPDSVVVPYGSAVEVVLYGKGFVPGQPGRNTVHFERAALTAVAGSADGARITFVIPDQINRGTEAPPVRLESGSYPVSVETSAGTSNVVTVRVYR